MLGSSHFFVINGYFAVFVPRVFASLSAIYSYTDANAGINARSLYNGNSFILPPLAAAVVFG